MTFARIIDGRLDSIGALPPDLAGDDPDTLAEGGYHEVLATDPRPADTVTATTDPSFDIATGTITWTQRPRSAEELATATGERNETLLREQIVAHLVDLRALAQSSGALTNTQRDNALRLLARGQIRLIRLAAGLRDGTD